MIFYIDGPPFEKPGKVKPNKKTVDRSELILKRNTKFSNQNSTTKPRCMLPFQKGMGEMSDKQKN